jgi:hypothetical protein
MPNDTDDVKHQPCDWTVKVEQSAIASEKII